MGILIVYILQATWFVAWISIDQVKTILGHIYLWSMQSYEPTYMELKINFTNPTFVSTQGGYDQIEVEFNS